MFFRKPRPDRAQDSVVRAHARLLDSVFLHIRSRHSSFEPGELFDLADALHNISGIFGGYGVWMDDSKYRELYLRPFDRKWGHNGIHLEDTLTQLLEPKSRT